jgi:hypothetical protein
MPKLTEKEAQEALSSKLKEKIASMSDAQVAAENRRYDIVERLEKIAADEEVGGVFQKLGRDAAWEIFSKKVAEFGGIEKMSDEQKAEAVAAVEEAADSLAGDIAERETQLVDARLEESGEAALPEKDAADLAALRAYEELHPGELAKIAAEKLAGEGYELVGADGKAVKK